MISPLPDINVSELGVPSNVGQHSSPRPSLHLGIHPDGGGMASDRRSVAEAPPTRRGRNLVICLDGTLNTVGENATNVLQMFTFCDEDPSTQIRHYQTGIGINLSSWKRGSPLSAIKRTLDSAVAYRLGEHVTQAYRFLVRNWQPQDRTFVFGFSRGAYAARCLAGMIEKVGLLTQGNENSISLAYECYKRSQDTESSLPGGLSLSEYFSSHFTRPVTIHFLGVWDTVSSTGALVPRDLPFSTSSSAILHFRQAVALDERRCLYTYHPHHSSPSIPTSGKTVKEVFFAGAHSDVGGGSFPATTGQPALSNISLKWMLKEAVEHGLKLSSAVDVDPRFAPFYVPAIFALGRSDSEVCEYVRSVRPDIRLTSAEALALAVLHLANDPSSSIAIADARAPRSDALSFKIDRNRNESSSYLQRLTRTLETFGWNVLEVLPIAKRRWSTTESKFKLTFRPGLATPRSIPGDATLHDSVRIREQTPVGLFAAGNNENVPEKGHYTYKAAKKV